MLMSGMQIEIIESMTGAMDPTANFTLIILQTELERVKFLLRSYLRARIAKVRFSLRGTESKTEPIERIDR